MLTSLLVLNWMVATCHTFTMQLIRDFNSVVRHISWLTGSALLLLAATPVSAQTTVVQQDFTDSTAYGWTPGGTFEPCLTAVGPSAPGSIPNCGNPADPPGQGVLRLTDIFLDQRSFVFYDYAIPSDQGLVITFDYFAYGGRSLGPGSGADGLTFFLFDGSTPDPRFGAPGGALGYAQEVSPTGTTPGLTNAYLGVGIDEFGNFANDYEGRGNGCPDVSPFGGGTVLSPPTAQIRDSVTVRGPGSGTTGYCFLGNSGNLTDRPGGFGLDNPNATTRTEPNTLRRVRVTLGTDNTVTLEIDPTGTGLAYQTILASFPAPPNRPDSFKFGFSSSTGSGTNIHELINLRLETINTPPRPDLTVTKTHQGNFAQNGTGSYNLAVQNLPTATGPTYGPVEINDTLPAGFSFVSATGNDWNCLANGQLVTCFYDGPAVPPGGILPELTINVNVTAPPGTYVNQAEVTTPADSNLDNNTSQDPTIITGPVVGSKTVTVNSGNGTAQPGDILQYAIAIRNNTPNLATGITFQDAIPANTTYVPGSTQLNGSPVPDVNGTMPFTTATAVNSPDATSGQITANNAANVTFQVQINNPLPDGVTQVTNQGIVTGNGFPPTPTDEPDSPPFGNPTVVPLTPTPTPNQQANLRLVKRITNIVRDGLPLAGVDFNRFIDDPNDTSDNASGWSQLPLLGVFQLNNIPIKSGDEVAYTVYLLSDGNSPTNNVRFCDLIPDGTTFISNSIQAVIGTTPINSNFFSPLAPLPAGNTCSNQTNPNGAVIVNLGDISNVAGSNFGFVRFRVKID